MTTKNEIKKLFKQDWVFDFLKDRVKNYWPNIQKLISVEIETLKIFLNYERISLRYRLSLENSNKQIENKEIIVKAEKIKPGFLWPRRIGKVIKDYQATSFVRNCGLSDLVPKPLEFYSPLQAYFYEALPGFIIKKLLGSSPRESQDIKIDKFIDYLPSIATTLLSVHSIKTKPFYASASPKKLMDKQFNNYLNLIKKYYSPAYNRFKAHIERLKKIRKKYENYLFDSKKYSLTHGDFQSDNILVGDNKIFFLDWADSNFFNPLDDLGSFFIQTELHLKYVLPKSHRQMIEKIKQIFNSNYFKKQPSFLEQAQIDYFATRDILRIISFISFTQKPWQPVKQSEMMESLLRVSEEKIDILEQKYL